MFVVGGSTLYQLSQTHKDIIGTFLTDVEGDISAGDAFFPWAYVKENCVNQRVNEIAYSLIHDSCKNLNYEDDTFFEKSYKYRFYFYHK